LKNAITSVNRTTIKEPHKITNSSIRDFNIVAFIDHMLHIISIMAGVSTSRRSADLQRSLDPLNAQKKKQERLS
jgi:hypothetical protein